MKDIEDEIPFEVPDGWAWCRLGKIGTWQSGSTPDRKNINFYENGTIPWLFTGDLTDGIITDIPNKITELAFNKTSLKLNPKGSVCIAMYGGTIGKLGILDFPVGTICDYGKSRNASVDELNDETWVLDLEDIEKDTGRILE